jgi:heme exporter protein CcmD
MNDFLHQGGYAFYVWSAYGISALALAGLTVWVMIGWRAAKARLAAVKDEDTP